MKRKTAFLFSGQGSQYFQMGRGLYEQNLVFRSCMEQMDNLARDMLGVSVAEALYGPHGKAEPFDELRLTHPAIFMVEFALPKHSASSSIAAMTPYGRGAESLASMAAQLLSNGLAAAAGR